MLTFYIVSSIVVGSRPFWSSSCVLLLPSQNIFWHWSTLRSAMTLFFSHTANKQLWILVAEHFSTVKNFIVLLTSHLEGWAFVNSILICTLQLLHVFDFHPYFLINFFYSAESVCTSAMLPVLPIREKKNVRCYFSNVPHIFIVFILSKIMRLIPRHYFLNPINVELPTQLLRLYWG